MDVFEKAIASSAVVLGLSCSEGSEVVAELVRAAVAGRLLDEACRDDAIEAILRREASASTALPDGIALPHGRLEGLADTVCMIGVHPTGVVFDAPDGQRTHLFFQLLAPLAVGCGHIHMLARFSRRMLEPAVREKLLTARARADVMRALLGHDVHNGRQT